MATLIVSGITDPDQDIFSGKFEDFGFVSLENFPAEDAENPETYEVKVHLDSAANASAARAKLGGKFTIKMGGAGGAPAKAAAAADEEPAADFGEEENNVIEEKGEGGETAGGATSSTTIKPAAGKDVLDTDLDSYMQKSSNKRTRDNDNGTGAKTGLDASLDDMIADQSVNKRQRTDSDGKGKGTIYIQCQQYQFIRLISGLVALITRFTKSQYNS